MSTAPSPNGSSAWVPAHDLPSGGDRPWRLIITLIAAAMVTLTLGAIGVLGTAAGIERSSYGTISGIEDLGRPSTLTITSTSAAVTVTPSPQAQHVSVRIIDTSGAPIDETRGRLTSRGTDQERTVDVTLPSMQLHLPGDHPADGIEVLVPADLVLDLHLASDVGDLTAGPGTYAAIDAHSDVGTVALRGVDAAGQIRAAASVGDASASLAPNTRPSSVTVTAETGDVRVSAPGTATFHVEASTELGAADIAPGIAAAPEDTAAPQLTATSSVGDVIVTR